VSTARRLLFIDALRGFALFGVFGANLMVFSGIYLMTDEQKAAAMTTVFDQVANVVQLFFVETKFIGLFSLLFGISFWLFLDRARSRIGSATRLFYRRIGWLFLFGALHGWLLWCYDILRFYALFAIFLPLFVRMPLQRLLAVALSMSILVPAVMVGILALFAEPGNSLPAPDYEALLLAAASTGNYSEVLSANWNYDWYLILDVDQAYLLAVFGRLLLGLYAARALNLANLDGHRAAFKKLLLAGAIVGAAGNLVFTSHFLANAEGLVLPFLRRLVVESGYLGLTLAYAAGLALFFMNPRWKRAVLLLAPIGQMALTWFLLQTVFGIWLFYGFVPGGPHLLGKVGPAWLTLIWVVGFAVQIGLARAWMRRFRFGPAEWLWRTLTYWQMQPFKVDAHTAC
jgi:uncharacterized protein